MYFKFKNNKSNNESKNIQESKADYYAFAAKEWNSIYK